MTIRQEAVQAISEREPQTLAETPSSRRLILAAVGWCILAQVVSGVPVGIVIGVLKAFRFPNASLNHPISGVAMLFLASGTMLFAVRKRSAILGHGDRRAGVDDRPIARWWLLVVLGVLAAIWGFVASAVWAALLPQWIESWRDASLWTFAGFAVGIVVIAPLAEELFFRGWLWTALRRCGWRAYSTALLTCGLWIVVHLGQGLLTPLFLVPTAVILGFGRTFCGIRATIIIHALYNLVALLTLASLAGSKP